MSKSPNIEQLINELSSICAHAECVIQMVYKAKKSLSRVDGRASSKKSLTKLEEAKLLANRQGRINKKVKV